MARTLLTPVQREALTSLLVFPTETLPSTISRKSGATLALTPMMRMKQKAAKKAKMEMTAGKISIQMVQQQEEML